MRSLPQAAGDSAGVVGAGQPAAHSVSAIVVADESLIGQCNAGLQQWIIQGGVCFKQIGSDFEAIEGDNVRKKCLISVCISLQYVTRNCLHARMSSLQLKRVFSAGHIEQMEAAIGPASPQRSQALKHLLSEGGILHGASPLSKIPLGGGDCLPFDMLEEVRAL